MQNINSTGSKIAPVQILEYSVLFGTNDKPSIEALISIIPREMLIKVAGLLYNSYCNAKIDKLDDFFADNEENKAIIFDKLKQYESSNPDHPILVWTTAETPLQLLRYGFACPFKKIKNIKISEKEIAMVIFKIILILNEKSTKYNIEDRDKSRENMVFLLSIKNINMHSPESRWRKERCIMQLQMSVNFFEYLSNEAKYSDIFSSFLTKYSCQTWMEYIRSVFGLTTMTNYEAAQISTDLINESKLINPNILDTLSILYNENIEFSSNGPSDRKGNTDYKTFRDRPIIKMSNGDYYVFSWEFMIDKLYNSLYFDMKNLDISEKLKKSIPSIFTETFAEKIMFDKLIEQSSSQKRYNLLSENQMRRNYKSKNGDELGPPDYLLESNDSYIIFECKDIRIGGEEIESGDFNTIIDIYRNKLFQKTWIIENGNKKYLNKIKTKRIGITQLSNHIAYIRNDQFLYYQTKNNKKIYPVLVLSDGKYVHKGFSKIANRWYQSSLMELNVNTDNTDLNRPVIVMSFTTLIKYHELFSQYGFEHYFEQFYARCNRPISDLKTAIEANLSFDDYMEENEFHLDPLRQKLMKVITTDLVN